MKPSYLGRVPFGGQMRGDLHGVCQGVHLKAEDSPEYGSYDHRGGPQLVACASSEGLEEVTGEEFGDCSEILRGGEVGILHGALIARQRMAAAVLGQSGPAGEERPYGALVVADGVIEGIGLGYVAR